MKLLGLVFAAGLLALPACTTTQTPAPIAGACEWKEYNTTDGVLDVELAICVDADNNAVDYRHNVGADAPSGQYVCGTELNGDPVGRYWEAEAIAYFCLNGTTRVVDQASTRVTT
jgi:hypothetical protein